MRASTTHRRGARAMPCRARIALRIPDTLVTSLRGLTAAERGRVEGKRLPPSPLSDVRCWREGPLLPSRTRGSKISYTADVIHKSYAFSALDRRACVQPQSQLPLRMPHEHD